MVALKKHLPKVYFFLNIVLILELPGAGLGPPMITGSLTVGKACHLSTPLAYDTWHQV
jgi:hypothetical protein